MYSSPLSSHVLHFDIYQEAVLDPFDLAGTTLLPSKSPPLTLIFATT